jgi:oxygen-independent coproporphyrinogen-3 oxidase
MNRAHTAAQSLQGLQIAKQFFDNISIDLIYGLPEQDNTAWQANIAQALDLQLPHLSCYALTVEPKTLLEKKIRNKQYSPVVPEKQSEQFMLLMQWMEQAGYRHYEISNFALPGKKVGTTAPIGKERIIWASDPRRIRTTATPVNGMCRTMLCTSNR